MTRKREWQNSEYDAVMVGGGYASAVTLYAMLCERSTQSSPLSRPPLKILVVDRDGNFPRGMAYSENIDSSALLTTSFTPESSDTSSLLYKKFLPWLRENLDSVLSDLQQSQDTGIKAWLQRNRPALEKRELTGLYFSRSVFGRFLEETLSGAIAQAQQDGWMEVELRKAEATSLQYLPRVACYQLTLEGNEDCMAKRMILTMGSLPAKCQDTTPLPPSMANPQRAGLVETRRSLQQSLTSYADNTARILIAGSNAAAADILYLLRHDAALLNKIHEVVVVSPSGELPSAEKGDSVAAAPEYDFRYLAGWTLYPTDPPSEQSASLLIAALADIKEAKAKGWNASQLKAAIYPQIEACLNRMDPEAKRYFSERDGIQLTHVMRTTSNDYAEAIAVLQEMGKLKIRQAKVTEIEAQQIDAGWPVVVQEAKGEQKENFAAVLDCRGFQATIDAGTSPLWQSLLTHNLVELNSSQRGIRVNPATFETASKHCYVMGPLLAGMVTPEGKCVWHLESMVKIGEFADKLGRNIVQGLLQEQSMTMDNPRFRG